MAMRYAPDRDLCEARSPSEGYDFDLLDRPKDAVTHPTWIALEIAELLYQHGNEPRLIWRLFVSA